MEETKISGIAKDSNIARLALVGLPDVPGVAYRVFTALAKKNVNVDMILQSIGREETQDISFTVASGDMDAAMEALEESQAQIGFKEMSVTDDVCKVSIVGTGMINSTGIAAMMFEALYDSKINISMISTSEIRVSVLIPREQADLAMKAIHKKFFGA